jgi:large subunit ribosomal protein L25
MSDFTIEVEQRETRGKNANRRLRAAGVIPAVVYGAGKEPVPIQVDRHRFHELLKTEGGENAVFLLKLSGTDKSRHTMIREMQMDAIRGEPIHVDFQRILLDQVVRVSVQIELHGHAYGVKSEGGFLDFVTREVEVECLPDKIPSRLDLEITHLHAGQHVEAHQLALPEGVTLIDEPSKVIVSLVTHRGGAEAEGGEDEELLEKITAEPEVIGRGKDDE